MKAFITLLSTEDYLDAVLVLKKSFDRVNTQYPLVCGVINTLKSNTKILDALKREKIIVRFIEELQYHRDVLEKWSKCSVVNTASKLSLFDLKEFDKLVYIDADTIVLQNIDELMEKLDGSMIEPFEVQPPDDYGFTGLFVFQPKYHEAKFYKKLIEVYPCVDGDLLGNLWFFTRTSPYHRISADYCRHYTEYQTFSEEKRRKVKVVHFCNEEKPWMPQYQEKFNQNTDECICLYRYLLRQCNASYYFSTFFAF